MKKEFEIMKATGIVRRIDDLGRIVIPKEIRKQLKIREGESIEIFLNDQGSIILKKYSEYSNVEKNCQMICDSLFEMYKNTVFITSMQKVSFIASKTKSTYEDLDLSDPFVQLIEKRKVTASAQVDIAGFQEANEALIYPIVAHGDLIGALVMVCDVVESAQVSKEVISYSNGLLLKHLS